MEIHISSVINLYEFNLKYAHKLVQDVPEELLATSPSKGFENHPAFTLGHLVSAAALTVKYLNGDYSLDEDWQSLFKRKGPGDPKIPSTDRSLFPTKARLLEELDLQHAKVESLLTAVSTSFLSTPAQWRFDSHMPTKGELLFFMCITHESMHLGQLAAWRRAMNMDSALAKL